MTRYVAFLRAINVGGHTVKMDQLRRLFESIGLANVETFIASGNVIFESRVTKVADLELKIESHLHKALGYEVHTFLRSISELGRIAAYKPFRNAGAEATLYVGFLRDAPGKEAQRKLLAFNSDIDEFHFNQREVYWLCRTRFSESKMSGGVMEKALGARATVRNATTVTRIAAKYCDA